MTSRAIALALTALSVYAQEQPKTDLGDDFVPGDRVIFATDFSRDPLGGFPRKFDLKAGNLAVADVKGKRVLRMNSSGEFSIVLPEVLPQRFTMEFEISGPDSWYQEVVFSDDEDPYFATIRPGLDGGLSGPDAYKVVAEMANPAAEGALTKVRIMADGAFVKVYMNESRVANAPNAKIGRSKRIRFRVTAEEDGPVLFANFRLAAGGKDLYRALNEEGRVTAEGILFDTGSDRIRPESDATLNEIAAVLKAHADLRLEVAGHTDNTGSDEANQSLSDKRAASVKKSLMAKGIGADRLDSKGYGSSMPAASNDTPEGKQTNRRVELIRL